MTDITRDSHYVPRALLRRWSDDGIHVDGYRLLVSHLNVPTWERRALRRAASHSDLYTGYDGQNEVDEFERWIAREYEAPGLEVIAALESGGRVSPASWRQLIKFVALQDMRTPLGFILFVQRVEKQIKASLEKSVHQFSEKIAGAIGSTSARAAALAELDTLEAGLRRRDGTNLFGDAFRIRVEAPTEPGSDQATVIAEIKSNRSLWIESTRTRMEGPAVDTLCGHRWSVVSPHAELEWPITDHPVLKLNYYGPNRYDFEGGYGWKGSEIMMPISPTRLLYVQVGSKRSNRLTFTEDHTRLVQRLLVERAFRTVFMRARADWVAELRPREVNPNAFAAEQHVLNQWHAEHAAHETQFHATEPAVNGS